MPGCMSLSLSTMSVVGICIPCCGHVTVGSQYMLLDLRPSHVVDGSMLIDEPTFHPPSVPAMVVTGICESSHVIFGMTIWTCAMEPGAAPTAMSPVSLRVMGGVWLPHVLVVPVILLFESMLYVDRSQMLTGPMPCATARADGHVDWSVSFAATVNDVDGVHAIPVPIVPPVLAPEPELDEPVLDPEPPTFCSLLLLLLQAASANKRPP